MKAADSIIALVAQKPTDLPRGVAVVNRQLPKRAFPEQGFRLAANGTLATLMIVHGLVLFQGQAELLQTTCLRSVSVGEVQAAFAGLSSAAELGERLDFVAADALLLLVAGGVLLAKMLYAVPFLSQMALLAMVRSAVRTSIPGEKLKQRLPLTTVDALFKRIRVVNGLLSRLGLGASVILKSTCLAVGVESVAFADVAMELGKRFSLFAAEAGFPWLVAERRLGRMVRSHDLRLQQDVDDGQDCQSVPPLRQSGLFYWHLIGLAT